MAIRMQQRTGTYDQWNTSNPVLNGAEIGYESDTNKFKIGDGSTNWNDLPYFLDEVTLSTSLDGYIPESLLGANNGVAQLNSSGKLVSTQIPNVDEITQDAINTALVAGTGLDKTYDDNANTITIDIDSTVATKTYVDDAIDSFEALPSQTSNTGKFLTTDGSATSWATVDLSSKQDKVTGVSDTEIGYLDGVTSAIQTQLNDKQETLIPGTGLDVSGANITIDNAELSNYLLDGVSGASYGLIGTSAYLDVKNTNGYNKEIELDIAAVKSQLDTDGYITDSSTSTLTNKTLTSPVINGATVGGDLVPSTDATYDLGSSTNKFKDLYLSGTTLYLDEATIGLHSGNIQLSHSGNTTTVPIGGGNHTVATESYVDTAVSNLVDGAGPALDTLNELAAAINDDSSYAATITTALGDKAPIESPTFTGTVTLPSATSGANLVNIPNSALDNSSITINGSAVSLGGSTTIDALPSQTSNSGKYLTTNGTSASWETISFPYVPIPVTSVSSNISLTSNNRYFVDTSAARTLTLPASPTAGDEIQIFDTAGSAATNVITVASNSNKINGTVQDLEVDIAYDVLVLVYTGSGYGWVVI